MTGYLINRLELLLNLQHIHFLERSSRNVFLVGIPAAQMFVVLFYLSLFRNISMRYDL